MLQLRAGTTVMGGQRGMKGELLGTKEIRTFEARVWDGSALHLSLSLRGCFETHVNSLVNNGNKDAYMEG